MVCELVEDAVKTAVEAGCRSQSLNPSSKQELSRMVDACVENAMTQMEQPTPVRQRRDCVKVKLTRDAVDLSHGIRPSLTAAATRAMGFAKLEEERSLEGVAVQMVRNNNFEAHCVFASPPAAALFRQQIDTGQHRKWISAHGRCCHGPGHHVDTKFEEMEECVHFILQLNDTKRAHESSKAGGFRLSDQERYAICKDSVNLLGGRRLIRKRDLLPLVNGRLAIEEHATPHLRVLAWESSKIPLLVQRLHGTTVANGKFRLLVWSRIDKRLRYCQGCMCVHHLSPLPCNELCIILFFREVMGQRSIDHFRKIMKAEKAILGSNPKDKSAVLKDRAIFTFHDIDSLDKGVRAAIENIPIQKNGIRNFCPKSSCRLCGLAGHAGKPCHKSLQTRCGQCHHTHGKDAKCHTCVGHAPDAADIITGTSTADRQAEQRSNLGAAAAVQITSGDGWAIQPRRGAARRHPPDAVRQQLQKHKLSTASAVANCGSHCLDATEECDHLSVQAVAGTQAKVAEQASRTDSSETDLMTLDSDAENDELDACRDPPRTKTSRIHAHDRTPERIDGNKRQRHNSLTANQASGTGQAVSSSPIVLHTARPVNVVCKDDTVQNDASNPPPVNRVAHANALNFGPRTRAGKTRRKKQPRTKHARPPPPNEPPPRGQGLNSFKTNWQESKAALMRFIKDLSEMTRPKSHLDTHSQNLLTILIHSERGSSSSSPYVYAHGNGVIVPVFALDLCRQLATGATLGVNMQTHGTFVPYFLLGQALAKSPVHHQYYVIQSHAKDHYYNLILDMEHKCWWYDDSLFPMTGGTSVERQELNRTHLHLVHHMFSSFIDNVPNCDTLRDLGITKPKQLGNHTCGFHSALSAHEVIGSGIRCSRRGPKKTDRDNWTKENYKSVCWSTESNGDLLNRIDGAKEPRELFASSGLKKFCDDLDDVMSEVVKDTHNLTAWCGEIATQLLK